MPIATQSETRGTLIGIDAGTASEFGAPPHERSTRGRTALNTSERLAGLAALLEEDPVDLARISDEIRSQPELADAVRRVAGFLQLAADETVTSVEEAAIVLGTERLRILLRGWSAFQNPFRHDTGTSAAEKDPDRQLEAARSPESLYLASLTRVLGFGNSVATAASLETTEMSEMLLRDFLALLPRINLQLMAVDRERGIR
jgi:hypothetical protein